MKEFTSEFLTKKINVKDVYILNNGNNLCKYLGDHYITCKQAIDMIEELEKQRQLTLSAIEGLCLKVTELMK